jgi:hypothetical protein
VTGSAVAGEREPLPAVPMPPVDMPMPRLTRSVDLAHFLGREAEVRSGWRRIGRLELRRPHPKPVVANPPRLVVHGHAKTDARNLPQRRDRRLFASCGGLVPGEFSIQIAISMPKVIGPTF